MKNTSNDKIVHLYSANIFQRHRVFVSPMTTSQRVPVILTTSVSGRLQSYRRVTKRVTRSCSLINIARYLHKLNVLEFYLDD